VSSTDILGKIRKPPTPTNNPADCRRRAFAALWRAAKAESPRSFGFSEMFRRTAGGTGDVLVLHVPQLNGWKSGGSELSFLNLESRRGITSPTAASQQMISEAGGFVVFHP
jgi:hypothetical protein